MCDAAQTEDTVTFMLVYHKGAPSCKVQPAETSVYRPARREEW
jgi:hypothetical protein